MSSVDERIEYHKQQLMNAEQMFKRYSELGERWEDKYRFHQNAIINLEKKQKNNLEVK